MIKEITKQHLDRSFDLKREILHFQSVSETREDIFILHSFRNIFSNFFLIGNTSENDSDTVQMTKGLIFGNLSHFMEISLYMMPYLSYYLL